LLNVYYYAREARNPDTLRTFAPDIRADPLDTLFSRGWLGPLLGTAMLCMLLGLWPGLLAAGLHAVLYVFVLAGAKAFTTIITLTLAHRSSAYGARNSIPRGW
jgi:predicted lipid-binding transport protein (Tim44 family)